MKIKAHFFLILLVLITSIACRDRSEGPYLATGIKIGEVTSESAIVWLRLTSDSIPSGFENPLPIVKYINNANGDTLMEPGVNRKTYKPLVIYPGGHSISTIQGATTGISGEVMLYYRILNTQHWNETAWLPVDPQRDHTLQVELTDLSADSEYELRIVTKFTGQKAIGENLEAHFKTAPDKSKAKDILFTVSTGQAYRDMDIPGYGFKIYNAMLKLDPDFFVHTGDILYYDALAKNIDLARWHWSRTYSLWTNLIFHKEVASYFIKDDHDTWMNDCWKDMESPFMGEFTFEQGQNIFLEQVPINGKPYRTFRWGRDLQIWLMEGRDYRSPNNIQDSPDKTIWGKEQKSWFYETVNESDAAFKILISPTPIVGPDRLRKNDNHSNEGFTFEGNEIREFISTIPNMYVICGDRHWQYISEDLETGVREYSCGPASNKHAGGWSNEKILPEHKYLNVTGGFLAAGIIIENRKSPALVMSHYDVEGNILNADTLNIREDL